MARVAHASPTKGFFVNMITKDISLEACLLDLLDNCLDGARRSLFRRGLMEAEADRYKGFRVDVELGDGYFEIKDNCGGISIRDAEDYAFHFGRRADADPDAPYGIGLYGIGMKRAIFKIGRKIIVSSSTEDEAFIVPINVGKWLKRPDNSWDFPLRPCDPTAPGTSIRIWDLYPGIANEIQDPVFAGDLNTTIARDYSFILQRGLEVRINGEPVEPFGYELRRSAEFEPVNATFRENGVSVQLIAGMAAPPQEDSDPETADKFDPDYTGWFVICNERVVLPADKSVKTVWGNDFPGWHPQYNGFMGLAFFSAEDPDALPWTTTKRDVDTSDPFYQRTVTEMKKITRTYINYTNARKESVRTAKEAEDQMVAVAVNRLEPRPVMSVPRIATPRIRMANIQYKRPAEEVERVAEALGNRNMYYTEVGIRTYEFFLTEFVEG